MSVDRDLEDVILDILQDFPTGARMDVIVRRARLTPAGAGRPSRVKSVALYLIATERVVLTPELRLRLPVPPARKPAADPLVTAVAYAESLFKEVWMKFDASSDNDAGMLLATIRTAFKAGVKEGRRRQERDHARQDYPRVEHGMFRGDHE